MAEIRFLRITDGYFGLLRAIAPPPMANIALGYCMGKLAQAKGMDEAGMCQARNVIQSKTCAFAWVNDLVAGRGLALQ